ncbi:MAG: hypothetical protein ACREMW_06805 [Gemmatimonadales bacterium]
MPGQQGPYRINLAEEAIEQAERLGRGDAKKYKKLQKALQHLRDDPKYPGLHAHKWDVLKGKAPDGGDVWTAYVENRTPSAWRIFYYFPRNEPGRITILSIGPHP